ncbi:hypothetical protein HGQ17_05040 [Nesterenkonia sp. MY13]|uniref:Uncharacterized protein n=1 Tax=Nesterenkonia sedimenti TaxID=1463632 RepID=A0A7X8YD82_9MICC|nr:hypothetical protein [Nesterenkonia sedimenti]NLS09383.1 hypothetical protein [Nesterenkonia sedimenti]
MTQPSPPPPNNHPNYPGWSQSTSEQRPAILNPRQEEHRTQRPAPAEEEPQENKSSAVPLIGWATGLLLSIAAAGIAIWQVNEQVYSPEATAEQYWEAVESGDGAEALGLVSAVPDFLSEPELDNLLLSGEPLARSAELLESAELATDEDSSTVEFTAAGETHNTQLPLENTGTTWGFFDEWAVSPAAVSWFEVAVPGAPEGGIGQIQVNGEPVNLEGETARLAAFVPTAAEISIDSQWLTGSAEHVVTAGDEPSETAEQVVMELEASEAANELLHAEIADYFAECDQQVLMPSGCPVGISTTHRVDSDSIEWNFPAPEDFTLSFDADGWEVNFEQPVAEVSFEAVHFHTGEQLTETEQVPFEMDVQVGASGEDLIVSVTGEETGG